MFLRHVTGFVQMGYILCCMQNDSITIYERSGMSPKLLVNICGLIACLYQMLNIVMVVAVILLFWFYTDIQPNACLVTFNQPHSSLHSTNHNLHYTQSTNFFVTFKQSHTFAYIQPTTYFVTFNQPHSLLHTNNALFVTFNQPHTLVHSTNHILCCVQPIKCSVTGVRGRSSW